MVAFNNSTDGAGFAQAVARRLALIVWTVPTADGTKGAATDSAPATALPLDEEEEAESIRAAVARVPAAPAPAG